MNIRGGLDLLIVGYAGSYGTDRLLTEKSEEIRKRFGRAYLTEGIMELMAIPGLRFTGRGVSAEHLYISASSGEPLALWEGDIRARLNAGEIELGDCGDLIPDIYKNYGLIRCRAVGEGGVLSALWELLSEDSLDEQGRKTGRTVGCRFRYDSIPLLSITLELCELFSLNPYRLYSENCYLLVCEQGARLRRAFNERGISCEILGETSEDSRRLRVDGKEPGFLERAQEDELWKVLKREQEPVPTAD